MYAPDKALVARSGIIRVLSRRRAAQAADAATRPDNALLELELMEQDMARLEQRNAYL
jgi:hypothetical protein